MTGPISNLPGMGDGKSTSATGNKANGQKSGSGPATEAGSGSSSDQVSLSSAGLQLTGQARALNAEDAFAVAARIKALFSEQGAAALAAHGGKPTVDLRGLLQTA